jgi:hypothetical protein
METRFKNLVAKPNDVCHEDPSDSPNEKSDVQIAQQTAKDDHAFTPSPAEPPMEKSKFSGTFCDSLFQVGDGNALTDDSEVIEGLTISSDESGSYVSCNEDI